MRVNHATAIVFSGLVWLVIGLFVLYKGLGYLFLARLTGKMPLFSLFGTAEKGMLIALGIAATIGVIKGRFVFPKTVRRVVARIVAQREPVSLAAIYSKGYLCLIGGMMLLGMAIRFSPLPYDIRAFTDIAVGSALINGSFLYFRIAKKPIKE